MTIAQMVSLTEPDAETGGTAGAVRTIAVRNKLPNLQLQMATTVLYHAFRFKYVIGSGAVASIRLAFPNFWLFNTTAQQDIIIDMVTVEYPTGNTWKAVTFSASRSVTLTNTDFKKMADTILPSDLGFSDVTGIPVGTELWVKGYMHVASASHYIPVSRRYNEEEAVGSSVWATGPSQAHIFDTAATTITNVDGNGLLTHTGTAPASSTRGYSPIMLGTFVSGDPVTRGSLGDSITTTNEFYGAVQWAQYDSDHSSNPVASIEFAVGGAKQSDYNSLDAWKEYLTNVRVMVENIGTNEATQGVGQFRVETLWQTYFDNGIEKIVRTELCPKTTFVSPFLTEANQSSPNASMDTFNTALLSLYKQRVFSGYCQWSVGPTGIRGTGDRRNWYCDDVTAKLTGKDGTHPSDIGDHAEPHGQSVMEDEVRIIMQTVTVPQP